MPAPFGPTMAQRSPGRTTQSTPSSSTARPPPRWARQTPTPGHLDGGRRAQGRRKARASSTTRSPSRSARVRSSERHLGLGVVGQPARQGTPEHLLAGAPPRLGDLVVELHAEHLREEQRPGARDDLERVAAAAEGHPAPARRLARELVQGAVGAREGRHRHLEVRQRVGVVGVGAVLGHDHVRRERRAPPARSPPRSPAGRAGRPRWAAAARSAPCPRPRPSPARRCPPCRGTGSGRSRAPSTSAPGAPRRRSTGSRRRGARRCRCRPPARRPRRGAPGSPRPCRCRRRSPRPGWPWRGGGRRRTRTTGPARPSQTASAASIEAPQTAAAASCMPANAGVSPPAARPHWPASQAAARAGLAL